MYCDKSFHRNSILPRNWAIQSYILLKQHLLLSACVLLNQWLLITITVELQLSANQIPYVFPICLSMYYLNQSIIHLKISKKRILIAILPHVNSKKKERLQCSQNPFHFFSGNKAISFWKEFFSCVLSSIIKIKSN